VLDEISHGGRVSHAVDVDRDVFGFERAINCGLSRHSITRDEPATAFPLRFRAATCRPITLVCATGPGWRRGANRTGPAPIGDRRPARARVARAPMTTCANCYSCAVISRSDLPLEGVGSRVYRRECRVLRLVDSV
jgi:hypothetical protein